jgi:putative redox protein
MKAAVTWQPSDNGLAFNGLMDDGKTLKLDGSGEGLSPMQAVLMSVGACSSIDVVEIMRKSRQTLEGCVCKLEAVRAAEPPRIFVSINAHYEVSGVNLNEKHLARAVQLSCEKYCSVMLMLNSNVKITTSYTIL